MSTSDVKPSEEKEKPKLEETAATVTVPAGSKPNSNTPYDWFNSQDNPGAVPTPKP